MHVHTMIISLASLSAAVAGAVETVGTTTAAAEITIDSASADWTRRVQWGLARFRAAGLALPPIAISVHVDKAECDGNTGLFEPRDPVEVHLCSSSAVESRTARLITLHELAHAWAETQLTEEARASFLRLRGLDAWVAEGIPRHEWGAEHSAEVVSWGLMDEMIPIVRIYDASTPELAVAFDLLVGESPLWSRSAAETVHR